jgi:hypothetical protein
MKKGSEIFVGIDTAKAHNAVAVAEAGRDGEVRYLGTFDNTPDAVAKLVRKLSSRYEKLYFCYEAGSTGHGLYRQILLHNRAKTAVFVTWLGGNNFCRGNRPSGPAPENSGRRLMTLTQKAGLRLSNWTLFSVCVQKAPSNACGPYRMSLAQWLDRSSRADPRSS